MSRPEIWIHLMYAAKENREKYRFHLDPLFSEALGLAKLLLGDGDPPLVGTARRRDDPWETLARVWVRLLLYAAPFGNVDAHMRYLAQGGELIITHLWALLYHLNIREWKNFMTLEDA